MAQSKPLVRLSLFQGGIESLLSHPLFLIRDKIFPDTLVNFSFISDFFPDPFLANGDDPLGLGTLPLEQNWVLLIREKK